MSEWRPWTACEEQCLIAGVHAGLTSRQLADRLGRAQKYIDRRRSMLIQAGRLAKWPRRSWTAEQDELLASMLNGGSTNKQIAVAVGHTRHAVDWRRKQLGLSRERVDVDLRLRAVTPRSQVKNLDSIRMISTPWEVLPGGVLRRLTYRADDSAVSPQDSAVSPQDPVPA